VEEVDQSLRSLQPRQGAVHDDPIQTPVPEPDTLPNDLGHSIHGTPSLGDALPVSTSRIIASSGSPVDFPSGFQVHLARFGRGLPEWLMRTEYSRDEMIVILRDHITTVMEHYRGKVDRWVVVNEAMSPSGFWPRDTFFQRIGPDYVEIAFRIARETDPGVGLIYNDNNAIGNRTADHVFNLAKGLKEQGLIDGVGMQMHFRIQDAIGPDWQPVVPNKDVMLAEMRRYADLGLAVEITELDVNVFGAPIPPSEKMQRQAQAYADVLAAALESGACRLLTMFGFVDRFSWLLTRDDLKGTSEAPCIFDDDYRPKPAFFALRDTLAQT
jgi:endo-1,4-beta-xylanase